MSSIGTQEPEGSEPEGERWEQNLEHDPACALEKMEVFSSRGHVGRQN